MAESKTVVIGAVAANTAIGITKFIVAAMTGSSAMLSEGIHSVVDTVNDLLLLVGLKLSKREATPSHPFGYGKELYFWSLIVAILIFGIGGGISAYEGVLHMMHPEPLQDPKWNYIVLACAAVFEGISFAIAVHAVWKTKGDKGFFQALHDSKDPGTFTIVAEDGAALAGLALAAIGVYASHRLDMPVLDGAASVGIGLLLACVAVVLIYESRGLLIGEGVSRKTAAAIRQMAADDDGVVQAAPPLSMYFGPDNILLTMDVEFRKDLPADAVVNSVYRIEQAIRERYPQVKRIYIEARRPPPAASTSAAAGGAG
jgi:cation diffusion facilitator family transporter